MSQAALRNSRAANVCPRLARADVTRRGARDPFGFSDRGEALSIRCARAHVEHVSFDQLRVPASLTTEVSNADLDRATDVLFTGDPFKIRDRVVSTSVVHMINLSSKKRSGSDESLCDQPIDPGSSSRRSVSDASQLHEEVAVLIDGLRYDVSSMHGEPVARAVFFIANAPDTRNRVHAFPPDHGSPDIEHGRTLSPFDVGVKEVGPCL